MSWNIFPEEGRSPWMICLILAGSAGARSKVIGSGVPSAPIITINADGQATIIIGTTENQIYSQEGFSPDTNKQILYWREVFD